MKLVTGRKFVFAHNFYLQGFTNVSNVSASVVPIDGSQHEFGAYHKTCFEINIGAVLTTNSFLPFIYESLGSAYSSPIVSNFNPTEQFPVLVYRYVGIWLGPQAGTPSATSAGTGRVSFVFTVGDDRAATDVTWLSFGPAQPNPGSLFRPTHSGLWASHYDSTNQGLLYPPVNQFSPLWDENYGMNIYFNIDTGNYNGGKWRFILVYHEVQ